MPYLITHFNLGSLFLPFVYDNVKNHDPTGGVLCQAGTQQIRAKWELSFKGHIGQLQQGLSSIGKRVANIISYQFKLGKVGYFVFKFCLLLSATEKYNRISGISILSQSPSHLNFFCIIVNQ